LSSPKNKKTKLLELKRGGAKIITLGLQLSMLKVRGQA
jgi:hypothetical protein